MSRWSALGAKGRAGLDAALGRFPWVILCGAVGSAAAITALHWDKQETVVGVCIRLLMTVALGIPLFFSLRMAHERAPARAGWPIEWLGIPLLAAAFFWLPAKPWKAPNIVTVPSAFGANTSGRDA